MWGGNIHTLREPRTKEDSESYREKHRHTDLNIEGMGDMYAKRLYLCMYVCVNECFSFRRQRIGERKIHKGGERGQHTQFIPREGKERHIGNSVLVSPWPGGRRGRGEGYLLAPTGGLGHGGE